MSIWSLFLCLSRCVCIHLASHGALWARWIILFYVVNPLLDMCSLTLFALLSSTLLVYSCFCEPLVKPKAPYQSLGSESWKLKVERLHISQSIVPSEPCHRLGQWYYGRLLSRKTELPLYFWRLTPLEVWDGAGWSCCDLEKGKTWFCAAWWIGMFVIEMTQIKV